jgi:hypothetical protein
MKSTTGCEIVAGNDFITTELPKFYKMQPTAAVKVVATFQLHPKQNHTLEEARGSKL